MSRRPTDEQLGEMLKTPHFGKSNALPPADPVVATPMILTLEQIKPYDRNPRRERNPLYDDIKESIQAKGGLNNPFNVTRRPGEPLYMIESGGNTRLQILNELYRETGEERYFRLHVLYQPWKSEIHVLTAHLIENEKRGEMLFIDKALAIREFKQMYEQEDGRSLSLRNLLDRLKEHGYAVNLNLLSRTDYAVDVLLPAIPEALRAGLGRPTIERIRQLEKAFSSYWTQIAQQDEDLFGEIFSDALAENNRAEWDNDALRNTLEERMVEYLDVPLRSLRLDIDALLYGKRHATDEPIISLAANAESAPVEEPFSPPPGTSYQATAAPPESFASPQQRTHYGGPHSGTTPSPGDTTPSALPLVQSDDVNNDEEHRPDTTQDIFGHRKAAHEAAYQLADAYGLAKCLSPSPDWGLGFLVDLPDETLTPPEGAHLNAKQRWQRVMRQWVWWMLYLCSEETAQPERIPNLPESMELRRLYLEGDQKALIQRLGQPAWIVLAYQLLADPLFPEEHFEALMRLVRRCRSLRQFAGDDDPLWLERNDHAAP